MFKGSVNLTFRELYQCNQNWPTYITLVINVVNKDSCEIVRTCEMCAFPAELTFGDNEVIYFKDNSVAVYDRP